MTSGPDPKQAPDAARAPRFTVAHAILVVGTLCALALFFGLRRDGGTPGPATTAPTAAVGAASASAATQPTAAVDVNDRARAAAQRAIDGQRAAFGAKCAGDAGAPARGQLEIAFDAQGRQVARGLQVSRSEPREDILRCADAAIPPLTIDALGARSQVHVDLIVP